MLAPEIRKLSETKGGIMKPKEYLSQYQTMKYEYEEARRQYLALRIDAETVAGVRYDKEKIQSSSTQDLSDVVIALLKARDMMEKKYTKYLHKMMEIRDAIDAVPDARARELLKRRYIDFQSFEQIQDEMAYEAGTIYNYHGKALLFIKVPSSDEKK